ncbi:MAG: hypothetical protein MI865_09685 [Proteobacteria bacterium]|nr:hypothetical protein [Pseudomonadota bacterium]
MLFKITIVFVVIFLSACNQYKVKKKIQNLDAAITSYDVALRWAKYQDAYNYHVSPNGTQPPARLDYLENISIAGVNVLEKTINEDHTEAYVKTEISYFLKTEGTVRKIKLDQTWWVNEDTSQWFIDGEFPEFK